MRAVLPERGEDEEFVRGLGAGFVSETAPDWDAVADAVVPLDEVAAAHRAVAKGGVRGRYVLRP